ncbi:hypothetical protein V6N13_076694 [Hibiscus sabdariffa]
MVKLVIRPDIFTLISVFTACSDLASVKEGRQMHVLVMKDGFELDLSLCHSLITMYDKWGSILDAEQAFRQMNRAYALFHGIQLFLHLHIMVSMEKLLICSTE